MAKIAALVDVSVLWRGAKFAEDMKMPCRHIIVAGVVLFVRVGGVEVHFSWQRCES